MKIGIEDFAAALEDRSDKQFDYMSDRTIVTYGPPESDMFFIPRKYKFIRDEFKLSAMNHYDHGFIMGILQDEGIINVYFTYAGNDVLGIYGSVDDFVNQNLKVVHFDGLRKGSNTENIEYHTEGDLNKVMETVSRHQRITRDEFKSSAFFLQDTNSFLQGIVPVLSKVL